MKVRERKRSQEMLLKLTATTPQKKPKNFGLDNSAVYAAKSRT